MGCVLHWVLKYGLENLDNKKIYDMLEFSNAVL